MTNLAIGIMSGTSLDGIDVALVEVSGVQEKTRVSYLYGKTIPYTKYAIKAITECLDDKTTTSKKISSLHATLAYEYKNAIIKTLNETSYTIRDVDFVACHGQTITHIPISNKTFRRSSLQLGDGSILATLLNTTVVSNFRSADIAVGGQGAPLVPFVDYVLYRDNNKTRVMHNIGGISNVTILPKNCNLDDIIAFDTGVGNMMMNIAMSYLYKKPFDKDGLIAKKGTIIPSLLQELLDHPYLKQTPPKSTGRINFGEDYTINCIKQYPNHPKEDYIKTFLEFTIKGIVDAYNKWITPNYTVDEIIISGGGAHHPVMIKELQNRLEMPIITVDKIGGDIDYKEAIAFAVLGHHTLQKEPANVPSATSASKRVILGQISY